MRYLYAALIAASGVPASAQCPFVPTITPEGVMFYCPDDDVILETQAYDAYQWLVNGEPIDGAATGSLYVDQAGAGAYYSVVATLDGCTDTSEAVLVDAWLSLLPFLSHGGDAPYAINGGTGGLYCEGDTLLLIIGGPYNPVAWTNFGTTIPGETDDTLVVTTDGFYSAIVAQGFCPDVIMGVGVDVGAQFTENVRPTIVLSDGQLCPEPTGTDVQWYLDGAPFSTATCITPSTLGTYTVFVDLDEPCQALSEPFIATGADDIERFVPAVWPVPASDGLYVQWPSERPTGWRLVDMAGRAVLAGSTPSGGRLELDLRALAPGRYMLRVEDAVVRPVPVEVVR